MLNTGLLLSKPGESGYAKFRRFLISNSCKTSNMKTLVKQLKREISVTDKMYPSRNYQSDILIMKHRSLI